MCDATVEVCFGNFDHSQLRALSSSADVSSLSLDDRSRVSMCFYVTLSSPLFHLLFLTSVGCSATLWSLDVQSDRFRTEFSRSIRSSLERKAHSNPSWVNLVPRFPARANLWKFGTDILPIINSGPLLGGPKKRAVLWLFTRLERSKQPYQKT